MTRNLYNIDIIYNTNKNKETIRFCKNSLIKNINYFIMIY